MIATDLGKKQALGPYPKVIQQINFAGNLDWEDVGWMVLTLEEAKEAILDFSQWTLKRCECVSWI